MKNTKRKMKNAPMSLLFIVIEASLLLLLLLHFTVVFGNGLETIFSINETIK